jgi:uncharacterized repeat protein (TIGR01451 family)
MSAGIWLALLLASGCGPASDADLEILSVTRADAGALAFGDTLSLAVEVRNHGPATATVSAATISDAMSGLIRKGPPQEIRRNRTVTLELTVPVERPYVRRCQVQATVFPAHPGEPGNLLRDHWVDSNPDNHTQVVSYPMERALPSEIAVVEPIREVVESTDQNTFRRHYEAQVTFLPEGSRWAIDRVLVQTQTAGGVPVELLRAEIRGDRLTTHSIIWTGEAERRDSVRRALVYAEYRDCEEAEQSLSEERVAVALAPR